MDIFYVLLLQNTIVKTEHNIWPDTEYKKSGGYPYFTPFEPLSDVYGAVLRPGRGEREPGVVLAAGPRQVSQGARRVHG